MKNKIYDLAAFAKLGLKGKKIGILGGSFNPPHEGHLAVAKRALEEGLDYVVLMVAEQNPLKPQYQYNFSERSSKTLTLSQEEENIIVSTLESDIHSPNTYYTLGYLTKHFPENRFTWIMGIDCLETFHLWENYDKYLCLVDIMLFNREGYEKVMQNSVAGKLLKPHTCSKEGFRVLFIEDKLSSLSSTEIRKHEN